MTTVTLVRDTNPLLRDGKRDVPKLNQLASTLFQRKNVPKRKVAATVVVKKEEEEEPTAAPVKEEVPTEEPEAKQDAMEIDVPAEIQEGKELSKGDDNSVVDNSDSSVLEDARKLLKSKKSGGHKLLPARHRGAVGAIRLNQSRRAPVYRKMTLFRRVKRIVRIEMKRVGIQFHADSVYLIATAMENIMLRKVAVGNVLAMTAGKSTFMPRYAMLGIKLQQQPDLRQWTADDYKQCDQLLERSQFRNTELDVDQE